MTTQMKNIELMRRAQDCLKGKWGLAIGTFLVYSIILTIPGSFKFPASLVSLLIAGPFMLGAATFSLSFARNTSPQLEMIFQGFRNFVTSLIAYLLMLLYIVLWTLLLIVPGIIAALSYAMTFYLIADEPSIKPEEALNRSKSMMNGHKLRLFYLCLRLFLLALLCILTLGIGFLWLIPYANVCFAVFYESLKGGNEPVANL